MILPKTLTSRPLTKEAFAPFGDVIELKDKADKLINQENCERHHDLAALDILSLEHQGIEDGKLGISLFNSKVFVLPYEIEMMERHPLGSQAFIPMVPSQFLVFVAHDDGGKPAEPIAFVTAENQGINLHRNVWHGVLCPISGNGLYAVVDRIGEANNLEEYWFDAPIMVV